MIFIGSAAQEIVKVLSFMKLWWGNAAAIFFLRRVDGGDNLEKLSQII